MSVANKGCGNNSLASETRATTLVSEVSCTKSPKQIRITSKKGCILFKKILFTLVFALCTINAYAFDPSRLFSYYAENQDITAPLSALAREQNLAPSFTQNVVGVISGRFENIPAMHFLETMREAFGVGYYSLNDILYFYNQSETQKAFISTKVIGPQDLIAMLENSSIISDNLPIEYMPENDMLVVSGPITYIQQVQSAIAAFEQAQTSNFTMEVFPLKYAWADDISITSMDTQITIPGVATILRAMVTGSQVSPSTTVQLPSSVNSLVGSGLASQGQASTPAPIASLAAKASESGVNIIADPRVNSVIITDAAYRMDYYRKVIEDLDKPVELVEIHAAIVDIDSGFSRNLGVNFQGNMSTGNNGNNGIGGSTAGAPTTSVVPPVAGTIVSGGLSSTIYSLGTEFFIAQVEALQANNQARVLGKPSVLTMDNVQATLENTSTYYIEVAGTDVADLFKVESGTVLKVTPHIITNDFGEQSIKLVVNVQDNQGDDSGQAVGALPPIRQTKINTQAVVNEGQSLLIGGYFYEQVSESDSGVPWLKDIPLLGHLFKSSEKSSNMLERLILITPRIVRHDANYDMPKRVTEAEFSRSPIQADYHPPQQPINRPSSSSSGCSKSPEPELMPAPVPTYNQEEAFPAAQEVNVNSTQDSLPIPSPQTSIEQEI